MTFDFNDELLSGSVIAQFLIALVTENPSLEVQLLTTSSQESYKKESDVAAKSLIASGEI